MNNLTIIGLAAAAALAMPGPAAAQSGHGAETLFRCTLRNGKTVEVTAQGGNLFYTYGSRGHNELAIRGSARAGNVHFMRQRYAGPQMQLRFSNGAYEYIVHNMEGNGQTGINGISGLVVMRGHRRIMDVGCRRYSEFQAEFDLLDSLPEDSSAYTAM